MPRAGMRVLFVSRARRRRVERRFLPEALRQTRKAEADVKILALLDDPLGRLVLERGVYVEALDIDHRAPILSPAVGQPVGGDQVRDGLVITLRQLVARISVKLAIERAQLAIDLVHQ